MSAEELPPPSLRRIIFERSSPAVLRQRNRPDVPGNARCVAWLVEPSDNAFGRDHPASLWTLRQKRLAPDGSLRMSPPPVEIVDAEVPVIPRGVIEPLPDDGLLAMQWEFTPTFSKPRE